MYVEFTQAQNRGVASQRKGRGNILYCHVLSTNSLNFAILIKRAADIKAIPLSKNFEPW